MNEEAFNTILKVRRLEYSYNGIFSSTTHGHLILQGGRTVTYLLTDSPTLGDDDRQTLIERVFNYIPPTLGVLTGE